MTDVYFGASVVDPYHWMEEDRSPALADFMKAENGYARAQLDPLPDRALLLARLTELDHTGDRVWGPNVWGGHWFYWKREHGHEHAKFCVREGREGAERVLVDVEALQTDHTFAVDWTSPSLDGALVAYGVSQSGSEASSLRIVETGTGKPLPDTWDRMQFGGVSWVDARHFVYTRLQKVEAGAPSTDRYKRARAYLHELGRDPASDPAIFGAGVVDAIDVADAASGYVWAPLGSGWVFAAPRDGVRNEVAVYYEKRAALLSAKPAWKKLLDLADEVTNYDVHGDDFYFLSHKDAPRFKVMRTSLAKPDVAHAVAVVPESAVVNQWISVARDGLYVGGLDAGLGRVRRVAYANGASAETITFPTEGALDSGFTVPDRDGVIAALEGWTTSRSIYDYDPKTKQAVDTKLAPPLPVDFSGVTSEEVRVTSADGTSVPLSIVRPKAFTLDGSHPTWLVGYGAYGNTLEPNFSPTRLAWLERGGLFAFCHVRGGGELGEGWHRAGMLLGKQRAIEDMIACAEWLGERRDTSRAKLAGEGTSAGAIVVGGVITQRPELLAAALVRVGVSNPLRWEQSENVLNVPEFGTAKTEDGFKALFAMDPYVHVQAGVKYPAVLLTTGATDPRVAPWQAAKMTARLQAATASGKPVLLRVDYEAGHGFGTTASQRDAELADEEAFLLQVFAASAR